MSTPESICWTVIRYLAARWRGSHLRPDLDDAVQEVFVECFRQGGALEAAGDGRVPSFRAFLCGVVRNVAHRFESRPVRIAGPLPDVAATEERWLQGSHKVRWPRCPPDAREDVLAGASGSAALRVYRSNKSFCGCLAGQGLGQQEGRGR
jgi:DNA-directed RNA polymerase specialized sigma24 family protein